MNVEITRQYDSPKSLSTSTTAIINQFKPAPLTNSPQEDDSQFDSIPDAQDLLSIKQDLQVLLPTTESRLRNLEKGKDMVEKNVIINDTEDSSDTLYKTSEQSRHAALETLKRRKRREETQSPDIVTRQNDTGKPKKLDRSESPSQKPKQDVKKCRVSRDSSSKYSKQQQKTSSAAEEEVVDFVRVKPKDQIPITTFLTALEPYFRNLTEEDREFLLQKSDQGKPYLIPPLGRHYLEKWAEEDAAASIVTMPRSSSNNEERLRYLANPHTISDTQLMQNDLGGGTLTERLISSLVMEDILSDNDAKPQEEEDEGDDDDLVSEAIEKKYNARTILQSDPPPDIVGFEERLRRELRYVGLFNDEDVDWNAREDDEICAELRSLGREFKEQSKINEDRRKRLLEIVDCQLQYEQYRQVLDTLDNQVEQGYLKRFRPQKTKKRKSSGPKSALSENTAYAMEKRKTWIDALGSIFKDKDMNMPQSSIYEDNQTS